MTCYHRSILFLPPFLSIASLLAKPPALPVDRTFSRVFERGSKSSGGDPGGEPLQ